MRKCYLCLFSRKLKNQITVPSAQFSHQLDGSDECNVQLASCGIYTGAGHSKDTLTIQDPRAQCEQVALSQLAAMAFQPGYQLREVGVTNPLYASVSDELHKIATLKRVDERTGFYNGIIA